MSCVQGGESHRKCGLELVGLLGRKGEIDGGEYCTFAGIQYKYWGEIRGE
jgi:hypothetical protein